MTSINLLAVSVGNTRTRVGAFVKGDLCEVSTYRNERRDRIASAIEQANGALSEKTKEFMALGIAIATRCDSCIGFHVRSLVRLGASREELCEALAMATYMGGGPSYAYSAKALKAFDTFSKQA